MRTPPSGHDGSLQSEDRPPPLWLGSGAGSVALVGSDGVPHALTAVNLGATCSLLANVPTGVPNCAVQQQAQYGGPTGTTPLAKCGELVITTANTAGAAQPVERESSQVRPTGDRHDRSRQQHPRCRVLASAMLADGEETWTPELCHRSLTVTVVALYCIGVRIGWPAPAVLAVVMTSSPHFASGVVPVGPPYWACCCTAQFGTPVGTLPVMSKSLQDTAVRACGTPSLRREQH